MLLELAVWRDIGDFQLRVRGEADVRPFLHLELCSGAKHVAIWCLELGQIFAVDSSRPIELEIGHAGFAAREDAGFDCCFVDDSRGESDHCHTQLGVDAHECPDQCVTVRVVRECGPITKVGCGDQAGRGAQKFDGRGSLEGLHGGSSFERWGKVQEEDASTLTSMCQLWHIRAMKSLNLEITAPARLDKALADALSLSRAKVQRAIENGLVTVDGEQAKANLKVTAENTIAYDPIILEKKKKSTKPPPPLVVIYEDDDVVVVNKPAGLLVHETDTSTEPTLVDALLMHDPAIAGVGDDPKRAGLVHRLDKAASGVMIVAKTAEAFEHLKLQFFGRIAKKKYSVLVRGVMDDATGSITFSIARSKSHGRMAAKPESQGGKPALTRYEVVKQYPHHALLDVAIETGRTHQIRAHMFAIDHPVVGDTLYRQRGLKPRDIGRIFLHARELTIKLPSGEEKTFTAPLPKELEAVLEDIPKL